MEYIVARNALDYAPVIENAREGVPPATRHLLVICSARLEVGAVMAGRIEEAVDHFGFAAPRRSKRPTV